MNIVFAWDSPNMNETLRNDVLQTGSLNEKPNLENLFRWLKSRAGSGKLKACIFTNAHRPQQQSGSPFLSWARSMLDVGFEMFIRPKDSLGNGDIDHAMVDYIMAAVAASGGPCEVIIGSHDAARFLPVLEKLRAQGHRILVVGYNELLGVYARGNIPVLDLEKGIRGIFSAPLNRPYDFTDLPPDGKLFVPRQASRAQHPVGVDMSPRPGPHLSASPSVSATA